MTFTLHNIDDYSNASLITVVYSIQCYFHGRVRYIYLCLKRTIAVVSTWINNVLQIHNFCKIIVEK